MIVCVYKKTAMTVTAKSWAAMTVILTPAASANLYRVSNRPAADTGRWPDQTSTWK